MYMYIYIYMLLCYISTWSLPVHTSHLLRQEAPTEANCFRKNEVNVVASLHCFKGCSRMWGGFYTKIASLHIK